VATQVTQLVSGMVLPVAIVVIVRIYQSHLSGEKCWNVFNKVCCLELDDDEDNDRITVRSDEELKLMLFSVSRMLLL